MPLYEHTFIGRNDISTQQMEALTEKFSAIIAENDGKVVDTEYWGLKPLAYRIKKGRKAHFSFMRLDAPHQAVAEMERQMNLSNDVLRFLTVRVEEHETEPSAMMRKSDRDDRRGGRRGGPRDH